MTQHTAQARDVLGEKLRLACMSGEVRSPIVLIDGAGKSREIIALPCVAKTGDEDGRLGRDGTREIREHLLDEGRIIRYDQVFSANGEREGPEAIQLEMPGLLLPLHAQLAGGEGRSYGVGESRFDGCRIPLARGNENYGGVDSHEYSARVGFGGFDRERSLERRFLEKQPHWRFRFRNCRGRRDIVDSRFEIGTSTGFAGCEFDLGRHLRCGCRPLMGRQNLAFDEVSAFLRAWRRLRFVDSGIFRYQ